MNHIEYKKLLRLTLYGELNSDEQKILAAHLESCDECRNDLDRQRNILRLISFSKSTEVDDKLLIEARSQLRGAIRNERRHAGYFKSFVEFFLDFITVPFRTVLSGIVILVIGFVTGYFVFHSSGVMPDEVLQNPGNGFALIQNDVTVSNLTFTDSNPFDGEVEFTFDAVKPMTLKGSVDDPKIQSILT